MRQTVEKEQETKPCHSSRALYALLTSYSREDINHSFKDINKMFMEWVGTIHADDTGKRESVAYSMEIIQELETIVTAIPKKKIKALLSDLIVNKASLEA